MIPPSSYEDSLGEAENTCFEMICDALQLRPGVDATVSLQNGRPDCAVFDIGSLATPVLTSFPSPTLHFRARLSLYNRDRATLQRWIMRLLREMPIGRNYLASHPLRENSIVSDFRIAPVPGNISTITPTDVSPSTSVSVPTFTVSVSFDVVFTARSDEDAPQDGDSPDTPDTPHGDDTDPHHGPCPGGVTGGEGLPPMP